MELPPILTGLRVPVLASPMFIVSGPELVIAQSRAGIIGSFPSLNARPQSMLKDWLVEISESLEVGDGNGLLEKSSPYAVNLIVHKTNDRLDVDLSTIVENRVPIVITSLGARAEVNDAVHSYGGIVLHDVINNVFAHKAIEKGADGLIAVAAGAGGHAGTQSPFALVQEIRSWFDGPVVLGGAIAHGRAVLAAQVMGADLAYVGSAFIAAEEADAEDRYKRMIVESAAADIVYSNLFTGVHGNYLRGSIAAAGLDPEHLRNSDPSAMSFTDTEGVDSKPWRDIWGAGHGIGVVNDIQPTAVMIDRLAAQYEQARFSLSA
ncbi:NAD(P)H-dependent flavin oxidoreductase [Rhodococcus globerulus]|uniref:Nitronate monooxygenase family protein n=1 Tax=Rhodococcus globerulus TaxID=33008 RepID=A0ABU4C519_RHOGO|nr:nitronate monooxygenase family protein [Rhodococcus globerulus]MDV6271346.1 nitronate monooxygenase family protein [Rhodococcus globerulus]